MEDTADIVVVPLHVILKIQSYQQPMSPTFQLRFRASRSYLCLGFEGFHWRCLLHPSRCRGPLKFNISPESPGGTRIS